MKILAIETSCDETAIALVEAKGGLKQPRFKILKNLVASQIKIHQPFGGVVPNLAKREHLRNLPILFKKIQGLGSKIQDMDIVAVTVGPGLEPALWTGINFAQELHGGLKNSKTKRLKTKLIGVSHLDGHLYSFLINQKTKITNYQLPITNLFPAVALIVSGGHTILIKMDSLTKIKILGETVDDAVGEAFDKVARILDLKYPGGPEIEKLAKKGNPDAIVFPRPMLNQKNYNFSYSGLKTSVLYYIRDLQRDAKQRMHANDVNSFSQNLHKFAVSHQEAADIAASFQKAAFDVLIKKTLRAAEEFKAKSIMISGGVSANKTLQSNFKQSIKIAFADQRGSERGSTRIIPKLFVTKYPTDNAVMIASAAYVNYLRKKKYKLVANGNLGI